nr:ATP-dependent DNA helicase [Colletotrichum truncatum]KAF6793935.1 ATP-dependent DNA helicase [Colletotrichum truncatum]
MQMQLLIRHDPSLEPQKWRYRPFGEIPGELCILSVMFSVQATRLCLALREVAGLPPLDVKRIDGVLRAAGRYALMVHSSSSMTATVIADIEARGLSKPWDRLAIVANCCQYPVRLDGGALSRRGRSPSLSVLAVCLLNGEILDNGNNDMASAAGLTMSEFLGRFMLRRFKAPEDEARQLTFNKGVGSGRDCNKGPPVETGPVIDTARWRRK